MFSTRSVIVDLMADAEPVKFLELHGSLDARAEQLCSIAASVKLLRLSADEITGIEALARLEAVFAQSQIRRRCPGERSLRRMRGGLVLMAEQLSSFGRRARRRRAR